MTGMRMAALALGLLSAAGPAWAADLDITRAWARLPAGAPNGAAFMTIVNKGPADRLTGAKADLARTVELHTHVQEGDIMRMRPVPAIDVPAGQTVTMKPGGLHVMLMGVSKAPAEGSAFPVILHFEKAGDITVQVTVQAPGAMGHGGH